MLFSKQKWLLFSLAVLFFSANHPMPSAEAAYEQFLLLEASGKINQEESILLIFEQLTKDSFCSRKSIAQSIHALRKQLSKKLRSIKRGTEQYRKVYVRKKGLKRLLAHIKKHRHAYDALSFACLMKKRYQHAFGNEYIVEDVYKYTDRFHYSLKRGDLLMKFFKQLQDDLGQLIRLETRLHSKYAYIKPLNYSLKIECTKLRNEILFHPWYRYRLRDGYEVFADSISPMVFMGKVLFHVVPSVFCIIGLTISTAITGNGPNQD